MLSARARSWWVAAGAVAVAGALLQACRTDATTTPQGTRVGPPVSLSVVSGDNQTAVVGTPLPNPVVIRVTDSSGNGVPEQIANFVIVGGNGSVFAAGVITDSLGEARELWTLGTVVADSQVLEARAVDPATGAPLVFATFHAVATVGAPARLVKASVDSTQGVAGTAIATPPAVKVTDQYGNPVSGVAVSFAVSGGGGSGTGLSATTNAGGVATLTSWTLGATAGTNTVAATAPSISGSGVTFTAIGTVGAASALAFVVEPTTWVPGSAMFGGPAQVTARDAFGNLTAIPSGTVSLSLTTNPSGAGLTGASALVTNGVATFPRLTVTLAGTGYVLTASLPGLLPAVSTPFTIINQQIFANGGSASAMVGTSVAVPPSVIVKDVNGNPVSGVPVSFGVASGGGSTSGGTTQFTNASGIATVTGWTLGTTPGSNTLIARAPPGWIGSPLTFTATGTPGPASTLVFAAVPGATTAGTAIAPAVQVTARDAYGNLATSFTGLVTVSLTTNPSGAALSGTVTVAAVAGVATFPNLSVSLAGTGYVLGAAATGLASIASAPFATVSEPIDSWAHAVSGVWSNGANWSLGRAPQPGDSVVIGFPGSNYYDYVVTLDVPFSGNSIEVAGGTFSASSKALAVSGGFAVMSGAVVTLDNLSVSGSGTLVNQGSIELLDNVTVSTPIDNQGSISVRGSSVFTGSLTTGTGSSIYLSAFSVVPSPSVHAVLTLSGGFTNDGVLDLAPFLYDSGVDSVGSTLTVAGGTLTNAATGTISLGGAIAVNAQINNQGTITTYAPVGTPGFPRNFSPGTVHINGSLTTTGTLNMMVGPSSSAGASFNTLAVNGSLVLGGTLAVLAPVVALPSGNISTSLTSTGTISGTFSVLNLPAGMTVQYNATSIVLIAP